MNFTDPLLLQTRRHFFGQCALGVGSMALASMLSEEALRAGMTPAAGAGVLRQPHFPARAKAVIYLFMAGGPSQLELFDHKPKLQALHNKPIPDEFIKGKRFAFMDSFTKEKPKLLEIGRAHV